MLKGEAGIFRGSKIERFIQRTYEKLGMFVPNETFGKIDRCIKCGRASQDAKLFLFSS